MVTESRSDEPREAAGVITEELLHPIKEFQLLPGEISEFWRTVGALCRAETAQNEERSWEAVQVASPAALST